MELAATLLSASRATENASEKRQGSQLAKIMNDAPGKAFTLTIADQVFRHSSTSWSAAQFRRLVGAFKVPAYLGLPDRTAMTVGATASRFFPGVLMPAVTGAMRRESSSIILPAEEPKLKPILRKRHAEGVVMNLNQFGEADAEKRMLTIITRIPDPECG